MLSVCKDCMCATYWRNQPFYVMSHKVTTAKTFDAEETQLPCNSNGVIPLANKPLKLEQTFLYRNEQNNNFRPKKLN